MMNLIKRRNQDNMGLPMTNNTTNNSSSSSFNHYNKNYNMVPDGSGKSIHMDAPIVRAAKNASDYTKGTYIALVITIFLTWWGWTDITYNYASTHLSCEYDDGGCILKIRPPQRSKVIKLTIAREQIVNSYAIHVNEHGEQVSNDVVETLSPIPPSTTYNNKKGKKKKNSNRTPWVAQDENGNKIYESYVLVLTQHPEDKSLEKMEQLLEEESYRQSEELIAKYGRDAMKYPEIKEKFDLYMKEHRDKFEKKRLELNNADMERRMDNSNGRRKDNDEEGYPNLQELAQFAQETNPNLKGIYTIIMRRYNVGHTRRRVSALTSKINAFATGTRSIAIVRETRNIRWQGILEIVFGMFSLLLTVLLGQFTDPVPTSKKKSSNKRRSGGGGSRSSSQRYPSHSTNYPRQRQPVPQPQMKAYGGYGQQPLRR